MSIFYLILRPCYQVLYFIRLTYINLFGPHNCQKHGVLSRSLAPSSHEYRIILQREPVRIYQIHRLLVNNSHVWQEHHGRCGYSAFKDNHNGIQRFRHL